MGVKFKTLLIVWMIVFSFVTIYTLHQNRGQISRNKHALKDLNDTKANVSSLVRTNDALRSFLLTACVARLRATENETGHKKSIDIEAARGYKRLANLFNGNKRIKKQCNVPPQER